MTAALPADRDHALRVAVRAAGGLVIRRGADEAIRVLLVHRGQQDDWSFPKGGQRRAETLLGAAVREVREETGLLCVAETVVGTTEHIDRRERRKMVRYWAMRPVTGTFQPTDEVDAVAWLRPPEALLRLSHDRDRELLEPAIPLLTAVLERRDQMRALSSG